MPMPPMLVEALEPRRLLAAGADVSALTMADRQELLRNWGGPNAAKLRARLDAGDAAAFDYRLLEYVRTRAGPTFFWNAGDIPADVAFAKAELSKQVQSTVSLADQILDGEFPEQTTSDPYTVTLPRDFSWTEQPDATDNPEFLYSLNRQGYWLNLAMAARFTGQGKYTDEIVRELNSWSAQQPVIRNPDNWSDAGPGWWLLDTAYRADNWLWTYFTVMDTPQWTPVANTLFLHRLLLHGDFLYRVTPRDAANNWTTTHARSLLSIGLMFPEFTKSGRWAAGGRELLFETLEANFRPDGGHMEQSPDYHGGVVADLLEPYLLDRLNGVTWPAAQAQLLSDAADAYYQLLSPDGTQPALSDSFRDNGMQVVRRAGIILGDDRWPQARPRMHDVFLLGPEALARSVQSSDTPTLAGRGTAYALPDSGYYVMRSGEDRAARQLIFDAGPKGGTHGHLDLLNFELFGYGRPLIADPGPLRYDDSAERAWAISTPSHNTISVDGRSHAPIERLRGGRIVVDQWDVGSDAIQVTAHHAGYADLKGAPSVARTIWYDRDDTFLVVDWGSASAAHTFTSSFTLPGLAVSKFRGGRIRSTTGKGDVMLQPLLLDGQGVDVETRFTSSNPPPNERDAAIRVAYSQSGTSATLATLVTTYSGSNPPDVSARWIRLPRKGRVGRIVVTRDGVSEIVYVNPPDIGAGVSRAVVAASAPPPPAAWSMTAIRREEFEF
jgi:hypothetical protein